jgi:hypothetical protein
MFILKNIHIPLTVSFQIETETEPDVLVISTDKADKNNKLPAKNPIDTSKSNKNAKIFSFLSKYLRFQI